MMKPKEIPYLVWDAINSLITDLLEFLGAFKKARTWSFILYATIFLMAYYRKLTWANFIVIISLIMVIYVLRHRKESRYLKKARERAFLKNDDEQIRKYYERYRQVCYFSKKPILDYEDYKKKEVTEIEEKRYIESGQTDAQ